MCRSRVAGAGRRLLGRCGPAGQHRAAPRPQRPDTCSYLLTPSTGPRLTGTHPAQALAEGRNAPLGPAITDPDHRSTQVTPPDKVADQTHSSGSVACTRPLTAHVPEQLLSRVGAHDEFWSLVPVSIGQSAPVLAAAFGTSTVSVTGGSCGGAGAVARVVASADRDQPGRRLNGPSHVRVHCVMTGSAGGSRLIREEMGQLRARPAARRPSRAGAPPSYTRTPGSRSVVTGARV